MLKHELLVPAGDMESLKQAVANGADAIYLGCKSFGARKFAKNFDNEEIIEAIKYCHLYGVKVYVTMNTLVKDHEVEEFLKQVEFLHKHSIDAILIQDFGMLCLVREKYPNLEVHASTQANTSSKETAELFHKLGVKRVVFSREMTLDEINSIDTPIEKEVFVHGALCICYSGCCLMSSMLGTRSGNRGECAGSCRLPYSLKKKNELIEKSKYLLSTKELNSAPKFNELLASNIASFKIEGRMKSPEYVGFITKYYRTLIDNYEPNINLETETNKLKTIFNREFTTGNLFNVPSTELMNKKTPNHIGLEIGRVIEVTPKKVKIKLNEPLNQQDGIRFLNSKKGFIVNFLYDKNNKLVNTATDICYVDNKVDLKENDIICKTQDYNLIQELKNLPTRKIPIEIRIKAKLNEALELIVSDNINNLSVQGNIVQQSINSPISIERIKMQIEKLGETPFKSINTIIDADENIFISIKELNELRRTIIDELIKLRSNIKQEIIIKEPEFDLQSEEYNTGITASVFTEEQLKTCLKLNINRIYVEPKELYEKYKDNNKIYYKIPRCSRTPIKNLKSRNLISDYFDFSARKEELIGDYGLNITNIYSIYYLTKLNLKIKTVSVELSQKEIQDLIQNYKKKFNNYPFLEIVSYGRVENMLIKGNILNLIENEYDYNIIDFKNRIFPVYYDGINTHILNYENKFIKKDEILNNNISLRLNFFDESSKEVEKIVNHYIL